MNVKLIHTCESVNDISKECIHLKKFMKITAKKLDVRH